MLVLFLACTPSRSVICAPGDQADCPDTGRLDRDPTDPLETGDTRETGDTGDSTAPFAWPDGAVSVLVGKDRTFSTIQGAILEATDGDTVLVREGRHYERIDFHGKGIRVVSEKGPWLTILDGSQGEGSVVQIRALEPDTAMLQGFTITGGTGTEFHGGGVFVENADPVIQHNIFIANRAGIGGGVYLRHGEAVVRNNLILDNHASEGGGGLTCTNCKGVIAYNTFVGNTAPDGSIGEWFYEPQGDLIGNILIAGDMDPFLIRFMQPKGYTFECADNLVHPEKDWVAPGAQGWSECTGTLYAPPEFVDPDNGDYTLQSSSQAVDSGPSADTDADGSPADRGAFGGPHGSWSWDISGDG